MVSNWQWLNGDLVKVQHNCKVGKIYPKNCNETHCVCDPVADSFGDKCGFKGCEKVS